MIFAPNLKKISIFRISYRKSFLGSKNVALQFLNFLGSLAPVSYRPLSYKKNNVYELHLSARMEEFLAGEEVTL